MDTTVEKGSFKNEEKILLILDLDETLIHAQEKPLNRAEDFRLFDYYVYKRPHLTDFINKVKQEFMLAVWSSASDDYVEEMVKHIFPTQVPLDFVWGRSRCTYRYNYQISLDEPHYRDYFNHFQYVKPLKKLKRQGYTLDKMLIVDDSPHKSILNYGNAIYPSEYTGSLQDDELLLLGRYLTSLKDVNSVRTIEKRNWREELTK